jgi:A/G-specific adenine glycosylase
VVLRAQRALVLKLGPDEPRWAGMWLFPNTEVARDETPEAAVQRAIVSSVGLRGKPTGIVCVVRHTVTRFRITLDAYRATCDHGAAEARSAADIAWKKPSELAALAMPKAHRAIADHLL